MLVRSNGLAGTMSRYLIRRIEETPNIELHTNTEVVALEGQDHLERVTWRDNQNTQNESHNIAHLFPMTGAVPNRNERSIARLWSKTRLPGIRVCEIN
jgi:thioredoxin reductase (NADPH)